MQCEVIMPTFDTSNGIYLKQDHVSDFNFPFAHVKLFN